MPDTLLPRKTPRQGRSRASYEAILMAAAQVLERGGMAALNTNLIAEKAGVSVGTLYQYFPNKETIAAELVRRLRAEMRADILQAVAATQGSNIHDTALAMVRASIKHHTRAPGLVRVLEAAEAELPLDEEARHAKAQVHKDLVAVLVAHDIDRPEIASVDLAAMAEGMVHAAIQRGEEDIDDITARVFRAVCGYLNI
ncbi:TetR/AcrR family transcriptional regulator [uncultured Pelagimonas sp.]|uniref:TetR/AcrR family transcriptional regulator n=1 Tax=uncultured Pelagimonas sp. TaxID=1618102 RepID=UPI00262B5AD8|nr:TetR/AcrR family transcriptional regulator [uncultured Pelagimonas sp.]